MKKSTKKLLDFYRQLPDDVAQQLLDFAEFLASRLADHGKEALEIPLPEKITRPEKESVVVAVKRLSATYPMINKDKLLDETSSLVSQNMLQGRDAVEVIDELEIIFKKHYEILLEESNQSNNKSKEVKND